MTSRRAASVLIIWRTRVYPFACSPMAHELRTKHPIHEVARARRGLRLVLY